MLLAQRPRELMLVGDEHRNQYFQVNNQVLTFFQFYFPMRSRNSIWPEIIPCWCGWRWCLVEVVGAELSVTKCLKFDLLAWNLILCCSQAEAVGLRLTLSTLGRPSSGLICHHHFITNQPESYAHTGIQVCVLYSTEACWHLSPSFHQLDLLCPHSLIIAEVLPLRELAWVAQRRTCLGDQPTRGSTWLHGTGN